MKASKAMKGGSTVMTKGGLAKALADEFQLKTSVTGKVLATLADLVAKEVKTIGKFNFPALCRIKTRKKPATKACKKEIFGVMRVCKAKPAKTVVKAFPAAVLKASV
jgi:nucleoid DNA-binding protein